MRQLSIWDILDENRKSEKVNDLVLKNQGLVWYTIENLEKRGHLIHHSKTFEKDDYYQIGMIGLIKAAKRFDETKGYRFSTYAVTSIRNTILNELKRNSSRQKSYDSMNISYEAVTDGGFAPGSEHMNIDDLNIQSIFERAIRMYPEYKGLLEMTYAYAKTYANGYAWKEVAEMYGTDSATIRKQMKKAKKLLSSGTHLHDLL